MFWHDGVGFRPVEHRDIEMIRVMRNNQATWMMLTDVSLISESQQERWFESLADSKGRQYFSVFKVEQEFPILFEGDFLGFIRFDQIDMNNHSARVGMDIMPNERSKGYGTKAFEAILKYCFEHWAMHRLWLCVLEKNEVAQKLYKKVGFSLEGVMREAIFRNGKWNDYLVMSILEDDYRGKKE